METRVEKYKAYRKSFLKEGTPEIKSSKDVSIDDFKRLTNTLPMSEVMDTKSQKNSDELSLLTKKLKKQYTIATIIIVVSVILIFVIIICALFLWRK